MKKKNVIIIGAGPAGISAAYELLTKSNDYKVTIIEADNQVGGISKTINYKGNRMDLGGHRFFSKEKKVEEFWKKIMPVQGKDSFDDKILNRQKKLEIGGPDPEKDDVVLLKRQRVSRIYYLKKFFDYPISLKIQTFTNMGLIRTIISGFSYIKSTIFKKKEDSLENFYINRFGKKLYSMFFEKYTEKLWGRHPREISSDWGSQRVKGLSIKAVIKDMFSKLFKLKNQKKETSLIEEFYYPKYGPGQMWEEVSKKVIDLGGQIVLNEEVVKVNTKRNRVLSIETQKQKYDTDILISSIPIKDLINSMSCDNKKIIRIANGLKYRDFITIGILVKKLKIKNKTKIKTLSNIVPDCWIYIQEDKVKLGRIQIFNNWSPYMVKDVSNTVWMGLEYFCNENDQFWNLSDEEAADYAIKELESMGIIDKEDVIDYNRIKVKKAYPAYFDTYKEFDSIKKYLNQFDNLYCIGRNGQHRYNNMDHSMCTAFEAVNNILTNKKEKENIWNVNTEKEYHEEKNN